MQVQGWLASDRQSDRPCNAVAARGSMLLRDMTSADGSRRVQSRG